ncbi:MAG: YsnF/AvaK domain-containing protein [Chloroflexota bacterium]
MLDNTMQNTMDEIPTGATVYDSAGAKVGTVAGYDSQAGYFLVEKGWLFVKDIYIPTSAIARMDPEAVYLQVLKDDLNQDIYANPPAAGNLTVPTDYGATAPTVYGDTGQNVAAQSGDIRVPVREEELVTDTRQAEQGRVRVHKDVVEEDQTITVPVRKERVTVERVPYSGDGDQSAFGKDSLDKEAFTDRDIDVPVMGEEVVVGKRVRGVEEVRIHKDAVTDQQQVNDTVRKERVKVDGVDDQGRAPIDKENM